MIHAVFSKWLASAQGTGAARGQVACDAVHPTYHHRINNPDAYNFCTVPGTGYDVVLFAGMAVAIAACLTGSQYRSLVVMLTGGAIAALNLPVNTGRLGNAVAWWLGIKPYELFFYVFLPPLLLDAAVRIEFYAFKKMIVPVLGLAFAVVAGTAALVIPIFLYGFRLEALGWNWACAALYGAMVGPTDAVAIINAMKTSGGPTRLRVILEGEALLNDASSITLFHIFFEQVKMYMTGSLPGHSPLHLVGVIFKQAARLTAGGIFVGFSAGFIMQGLLWMVRFGRASHEQQVALSLAAGYLAFYVAENPLETSGVVAVVVFGLYGSYSHKWGMSRKTEGAGAFAAFWDTVCFAMNNIVFFYAGVSCMNFFWRSISVLKVEGNLVLVQAVGVLLGGYVTVFILRLLLILVLNMFHTITKQPLSFREVVFLTLGGVRGAVSLIMAQAVVNGIHPDDHILIRVKAELALCTAGFVLLTLILNGTLVGHLMQYLQLNQLPEFVQERRKRALEKLVEFAEDTMQELRDTMQDERALGADWSLVDRKAGPAMLREKLSSFVTGGRDRRPGTPSRYVGTERLQQLVHSFTRNLTQPNRSTSAPIPHQTDLLLLQHTPDFFSREYYDHAQPPPPSLPPKNLKRVRIQDQEEDASMKPIVDGDVVLDFNVSTPSNGRGDDGQQRDVHRDVSSMLERQGMEGMHEGCGHYEDTGYQGMQPECMIYEGVEHSSMQHVGVQHVGKQRAGTQFGGTGHASVEELEPEGAVASAVPISLADAGRSKTAVTELYSDAWNQDAWHHMGRPDNPALERVAAIRKAGLPNSPRDFSNSTSSPSSTYQPPAHTAHGTVSADDNGDHRLSSEGGDDELPVHVDLPKVSTRHESRGFEDHEYASPHEHFHLTAAVGIICSSPHQSSVHTSLRLPSVLSPQDHSSRSHSLLDPAWRDTSKSLSRHSANPSLQHDASGSPTSFRVAHSQSLFHGPGGSAHASSMPHSPSPPRSPRTTHYPTRRRTSMDVPAYHGPSLMQGLMVQSATRRMSSDFTNVQSSPHSPHIFPHSSFAAMQQGSLSPKREATRVPRVIVPEVQPEVCVSPMKEPLLAGSESGSEWESRESSPGPRPKDGNLNNLAAVAVVGQAVGPLGAAVAVEDARPFGQHEDGMGWGSRGTEEEEELEEEDAATKSTIRCMIASGMLQQCKHKRLLGLLSSTGVRVAQTACEVTLEHPHSPLKLWDTLQHECTGFWESLWDRLARLTGGSMLPRRRKSKTTSIPLGRSMAPLPSTEPLTSLEPQTSTFPQSLIDSHKPSDGSHCDLQRLGDPRLSAAHQTSEAHPVFGQATPENQFKEDSALSAAPQILVEARPATQPKMMADSQMHSSSEFETTRQVMRPLPQSVQLEHEESHSHMPVQAHVTLHAGMPVRPEVAEQPQTMVQPQTTVQPQATVQLQARVQAQVPGLPQEAVQLQVHAPMPTHPQMVVQYPGSEVQAQLQVQAKQAVQQAAAMGADITVQPHIINQTNAQYSNQPPVEVSMAVQPEVQSQVAGQPRLGIQFRGQAPGGAQYHLGVQSRTPVQSQMEVQSPGADRPKVLAQSHAPVQHEPHAPLQPKSHVAVQPQSLFIPQASVQPQMSLASQWSVHPQSTLQTKQLSFTEQIWKSVMTRLNRFTLDKLTSYYLLRSEVAIEFILAMERLKNTHKVSNSSVWMLEVLPDLAAAIKFLDDFEAAAPERFGAIQTYRAMLALLQKEQDFLKLMAQDGSLDDEEVELISAVLNKEELLLENHGLRWQEPDPWQVVLTMPFFKGASPEVLKLMEDKHVVIDQDALRQTCTDVDNSLNIVCKGLVKVTYKSSQRKRTGWHKKVIRMGAGSCWNSWGALGLDHWKEEFSIASVEPLEFLGGWRIGVAKIDPEAINAIVSRAGEDKSCKIVTRDLYRFACLFYLQLAKDRLHLSWHGKVRRILAHEEHLGSNYIARHGSTDELADALVCSVETALQQRIAYSRLVQLAYNQTFVHNSHVFLITGTLEQISPATFGKRETSSRPSRARSLDTLQSDISLSNLGSSPRGTRGSRGELYDAPAVLPAWYLVMDEVDVEMELDVLPYKFQVVSQGGALLLLMEHPNKR